MSDRHGPLLGLGLLLAVASTPGGSALAAEVVPYTGHLDRDGAPLDGAARMRFRLYGDAAAPPAPPADPCDGSGAAACVWAEEHPQVAVHNGAFTVNLGRPAGPGASPRDVAPVLRRKTPLFLEVAVFDGARAAFTVLGRQEIHPVPQAVFTLQPDLEVETLTASTIDATTINASLVTAAHLDAARVTTPVIDASATFNGDVTLAPGHEVTVNGVPFRGLRVGHEADPARAIAAWSGVLATVAECNGANRTCNDSLILPVVDPARAFCALTQANQNSISDAPNIGCATFRAMNEAGTPWRLDRRQINNSDGYTQVTCQATCLEW